MEKILIIENDQAICRHLSSLLENEGYCSESVSSFPDALNSVFDGEVALSIASLTVLTAAGEGAFAALKDRYPGVGLIAIADPVDKSAIVNALQMGANACLTTPVQADELKHAVGSALERRRLLDENVALKRQLTLLQKGVELAGCLDLDQLAEMVVSLMAAETGLKRGLGLFYDEEGFLSLKGLVGLDEAAGRELAERVIAAHAGTGVTGDAAVVADIVPEQHPTGVRDALIVRLNGTGRPRGVVALFNNRCGRLSPVMPLPGLTVLLQQSSRAIDNAMRYSTARNLANIDELTGLFNYRYLETALDREIKRAERYRSSLSVVFLDLDQFKDINDKHGHLVGSKVLKEVGLLIKSLVREVDTVIRYGGDEYTIILVESTNVGAARVAERIRGGVESHRFLTEEGYDIRITASLGYACYPDDSKTYAELLDMADQAMYRGKFSGKNVVFHIRQQEHSKQGE